MSILDELAKKDKYWREVALRICGNKHDADDLVQEMYLRRHNNDRGQRITEHYIGSTLLSIYLNKKKKNKEIAVAEVRDTGSNPKKYEPNDEHKRLLDRAQQLPFIQREFLELSYDYSLRELQDIFNTNYGYIYKLTKEARQKILGESFDLLYNNKRLKHKKMKKSKLEQLTYKELRAKYPKIYDKSKAGMIKKIKLSEQEKSKGLGDTLAKITQATGIKAVVEAIVGDGDCGCEERKQKMNHYFAYKLKPKCLEKQEIDDWAKFIKRRKLELLDNGKAKGRLEHDDVTFVCDFYSIVFNRQLWYPECYSCRGTALTLIKMMKQLDVVYYSNLNMPKDETT